MAVVSSGSEAQREGAMWDVLRAREEALHGLQGVADLKVTGPVGEYRGKEVLSVELPNRFRIESLNFMGLPDLVLCSDGEKTDLYIPSEEKLIRGKSTPPDGWIELSGLRIPLVQVLRILMGHPPFPLDEKIRSFLYLGTGQEPYGEPQGTGGTCQRLWVDQQSMAIRKGEILEEGEVWLTFQCADYREVAGFLLPFSLHVQMRNEGTGLNLTCREIRPNPAMDAATFQLILPSLDDLTILNLESNEKSEDLPR
jgi:hypothetical protein